MDNKKTIQFIMRRLNYNYHRGIYEKPIAVVTGSYIFDLDQKVDLHESKQVTKKSSTMLTRTIKTNDLALFKNFNAENWMIYTVVLLKYVK